MKTLFLSLLLVTSAFAKDSIQPKSNCESLLTARVYMIEWGKFDPEATIDDQVIELGDDDLLEVFHAQLGGRK